VGVNPLPTLRHHVGEGYSIHPPPFKGEGREGVVWFRAFSWTSATAAAETPVPAGGRAGAALATRGGSEP
jgi:hypothetical protein